MTGADRVGGADDTDGADGADDGFSPDWLALREVADARARSLPLVHELAGHLAGATSPGRPLVVHDLGCGTGSMSRWLARLLPGPQHWVLHDRDARLLEIASRSVPATAADGTPVTAAVAPGDLTRLAATDLAGAGLVTASALLDLLTADEVRALARACVTAGIPALFTLSVTGRVRLAPADPLDAAAQAAFNAHQRREVDGRRLLGPDAVDAATAAFSAAGAQVRVRPSPWRLGPDGAGLAARWLDGWVRAAAEQDPALPLAGYLRRRLATAATGALQVTVEHADLLATVPDGARDPDRARDGDRASAGDAGPA